MPIAVLRALLDGLMHGQLPFQSYTSTPGGSVRSQNTYEGKKKRREISLIISEKIGIMKQPSPLAASKIAVDLA